MKTKLINLTHAVSHRFGVDIVKYPRWATSHWALQNMLPTLDPDVVLDIGGHFGEYGALLRGIGYQGWIVSLEPVAENFELLSQKASADPKWTTLQLAAGSSATQSSINIATQTDFSSFLTPKPDAASNLASGMAIKSIETVEVVRLDEIWADLATQFPESPRVFIKTDTQGFDLEVLRGLGRIHQLLVGAQMELAANALYEGVPSLIDSLQYWGDTGFDLAGLYPVSHNHEYRLNEYDAIFVRSRDIPVANQER